MRHALSKVQSPAPVVPPPPSRGAPAPVPVAPPITRSDVNALQSRVSVLRGQLDAANARRDRLASQVRRAIDGPDRSGLDERIGQLDKRILQIETDIADAGRALSAAPAGLMPSTSEPGRNFLGPTPGQVTAISIVATLFVLFPLAVAFARVLWRRALYAPKALSVSPDLTGRLGRIEQGVELIALEVERIAEGQRFVSQLMSDNSRGLRPEPVRLQEPGTPRSE